MREDQAYLFDDFIKKTDLKFFDGKTILEIGSDLDFNIAKEFIRRGAKEVYCVNPVFPNDIVSPDVKIKPIKDFGENLKFKKNKFDCIFGICLLEHVSNIEKLLNEVNRMLKPNGIMYLQGCPMFLSYYGHHIWLYTPEVFYKFCNETNPFEPWEYLTLNTREDYAECLLKKGLSKNNAELLAEQYMSDFISKIPTSKIVEYATKVFGKRLVVDTWKIALSDNKFYKMLKDKYKEDDLNTTGLMLLVVPVYYKYFLLFKSFMKKIKIMHLIYS